MATSRPRLLAISDLHVSHRENRVFLDTIVPTHEGDWLVVAGDVAEDLADFEWALGLLRDRFARVIWTPGNHDLWTVPDDPVQLRGQARYELLVDVCRRIGVLTPEDAYPVWDGDAGPTVLASLFVLYDYSFRRPSASNKADALAQAHAAGVVCSDEHLLGSDPFSSIDAWCHDRVGRTLRRLDDIDDDLPTVLINHFPLVREPTRVLRYPDFSLWCGTERSADWHLRYRATAVVYGHLHIPRTTWYDGVRFEEVSLGYPRERAARPTAHAGPRQILPVAGRA